jgi:hypothetical protein
LSTPQERFAAILMAMDKAADRQNL